ncbi:MAG: TetR/AcrR family transcriptional regulator [Candidatus Latescibacteria bacterium]|nr:TetR/AcrR family transcriptional regulator [Candidatus Latescibacterota bacterium]
MTEIQRTEARQRILDAATSLFSKKGYAGVGVREIAKTADVNISMISYYFQGKVGILKEIIDAFHDAYHRVIMDGIDEHKPPEECMRSIIRNLVHFIRTHTELAMAAIHALPLDIPEIAERKAERVSEAFEGINGLVARLGLDPHDVVQMSIVGQALISIIATHFRLRSIQEHVFDIEFDDAFYERYTETISALFIDGITGMAAENQN